MMSEKEFLACEYRGVTTMIGHVFGTDLSHIPEWIMKPAQERGTAVHLYIEQYLRDGEAEIHFEYFSYRDAFTEWLGQFKEVEVVGLEVKLIDHEYAVKGVVDFIGYLDGELYVIDWKTSSNMSGETLMSATAQSLVYRDMVKRLMGLEAKTRVVSIQAGKHTDIELEIDEELPYYFYNLYKFKNKYKKPKRRKKDVQ